MSRTVRRPLSMFVILVLVMQILSGGAFAVVEDDSHIHAAEASDVGALAQTDTELSVLQGDGQDSEFLIAVSGEDGTVRTERWSGDLSELRISLNEPAVTVYSFEQGAEILPFSTASGEWQNSWTCYKDQLSGNSLSYYGILEDALGDGAFSYEVVSAYVNGELSAIPCWVEDLGTFVFDYKGNAQQAFDSWCQETVEQLKSACAALVMDHPEYFWIRESYAPVFGASATSTEITAEVKVAFLCYPATDSEGEITALQNEIDVVVKDLLEDTASMDTYARLRYVDNWLAENNHYNSAAAASSSWIKSDETPWSIVGGLVDGYSPVCEGYAKAFQLFCHEIGVPCLQVTGYGAANGSKQLHMWNYVQIDGSWYLCDPTWNDPLYVGSGDADESSREYFLVSAQSDHEPAMSLILPTLAKENYTVTEHTYGEWIESVAATCTEVGEEKRTCIYCGHVQTREIPLVNHEYSEVVTAPTCAEQGYTTYTCSKCNDSYKDNYVDATGEHIYENGSCTICGTAMPSDVLGGGVCGDKTYWKLTTDGTLTIFGVGATWDFNANSISYNYHGEVPWGEWKKSIVQVVVCDGVTGIGAYAFSDCSNLKTVDFGNTVNYIYDFAFIRCYALENPEFPNTLSALGQQAFFYCTSITEVTIPGSLSFLDSGVFENCENLAHVFFEDDAGLGSYIISCCPFRHCDALKEIEVDEGHFALSSQDGVLYIGTTLIQYPCGKEESSFVVPDGVTDVEQLSMEAARYLEVLTIPGTVRAIGSCAVWECENLDKVIFLGDAPESIAKDAFAYGRDTVTIYYPLGNDTWTEVTERDFEGEIAWMGLCSCGGLCNTVTTAPTCVEQGQTVHTCPDCGAVYEEDYKEPTGGHIYENGVCTTCDASIPNDLLGGGACGESAFWKLNKDGTLTVFGQRQTWSYEDSIDAVHKESPWTKWKNEVRKVIIEDGITVLGKGLFEDCVNLGTVDFGDTLTIIDARAFFNCVQLQNFELPDTFYGISNDAFKGCAGLTSVTIPSSLYVLGSSAFDGCVGLTEVIFEQRSPAGGYFGMIVGFAPFSRCTSLERIVVEEGHAYLHTHENVLYYNGNQLVQYPCGKKDKTYTVPEEVRYIGNDVFREAQYLETLIISSNVVDLGADAFFNCKELQKVVFLGDAPVLFSTGAFRGCEVSVWYPEGNSTWDGVVATEFEGSVTWVPVCECHSKGMTSEKTEPTCVERGYTTYTCSTCGNKYKDDYVDAIGHRFGEWVQVESPSCTEKGSERRDCSGCDHYETREVAATGHSHSSVVTQPTCTEQGYTTHSCACGDTYVDTYVPSTGHSYGDWEQTVAPGCTEKGSERRDCSNCDHYESREVDAHGHSYTYTENEGLKYGVCSYGCGVEVVEVGTPSWRIEDSKLVGREYADGWVMIALYGSNGRLITVRFCERTEWRNENGVVVYQFSAPAFSSDELSRAEEVRCYRFDENYTLLREAIVIEKA